MLGGSFFCAASTRRGLLPGAEVGFLCDSFSESVLHAADLRVDPIAAYMNIPVYISNYLTLWPFNT